MGKIADGKHFLAFAISGQSIDGKIICNAQPDKDENAECRLSKDQPECIFKYAWDNLGPDILSTPHHAVPEVNVWTVPLPITYTWEGSGENYTDYITPDLDAPSYPHKQKELTDAAIDAFHRKAE